MTAQSKARAGGINHVALEVGDIDAALDFYGRIFDLTLRGRGETSAFIDLGDQFIEIGRVDPELVVGAQIGCSPLGVAEQIADERAIHEGVDVRRLGCDRPVEIGEPDLGRREVLRGERPGDEPALRGEGIAPAAIRSVDTAASDAYGYRGFNVPTPPLHNPAQTRGG